MKPSRNLGRIRRWSRDDRLEASRAPRLALDCDFQPPRFGDYFGGYERPWRRPGFSALAREALRADASRTFVLETTVLGFITLVAAWPIAVMIHEVIRFLSSWNWGGAR
ncbi:MAG TPA: hypothetical protein VGK72_01370 [Chthoniobacterales bacterium]